MSKASDKIDELEEITQGGISDVSAGNVRTRFEITEARKALREARLRDRVSRERGLVRPHAFRMRLDGAW